MTLPPKHMASDGHAVIGLIVDMGRLDRMVPVLRYTDADNGREIVVELSAAEVRDLAGDAHRLMDADEQQIAAWWAELTNQRPAS